MIASGRAKVSAIESTVRSGMNALAGLRLAFARSPERSTRSLLRSD